MLDKLAAIYRRFAPPLTVGVRCFVARGDGHILLVRHTYRPGWYLPGGGVERGESLEAAIERELEEETGVTLLERPHLFHAYSNFHEKRSDHVILFSASAFKIAPRSNWEIAEQGFFDPAAPPQSISPATERRLAEWRGLAAPGALW